MFKFKIITLGCKVNQYESETLAHQLELADLTPAGPEEKADLFIVNTCTVTGRAAMQSRQAIRQAVRNNPGAHMVVTGCYAQTAPAEIISIDGVDTVLGIDDKPHILDLVLSRHLPSSNRLNKAADTIPEPGPRDGPVKRNRSRPFLKVQDGCEAFCTYCIVPYARGPSRSLMPDKAIDGILRLKRNGYHEVVLTGIHLVCYGNDLTPPTDLLALLGQIRKAGAIDRVRLSSIEPREISDALLRFVVDAGDGPGRICPHFHIPLQSGDDDILQKMKRPYTGRFFEKLVGKILYLMPEAAIGADVLVGFPGETDASFERTRRLLEDLPVAYLHVFPFSPRKGTPAYHFANRVPTAEVRERCRVMRMMGDHKKYAFYRRFVGKPLEVIIEDRKHLPEGYRMGTSANYIPVLIEKADCRKESLAPLDLVVEKVEKDLRVYGKPV
ncbi:MAG: tRNA (N(6)-L-threonylcarbamoyladenosine(37)-C(2))-methylthiotransferase MtaB [Desulfobacterales bacterium]